MGADGGYAISPNNDEAEISQFGMGKGFAQVENPAIYLKQLDIQEEKKRQAKHDQDVKEERRQAWLANEINRVKDVPRTGDTPYFAEQHAKLNDLVQSSIGDIHSEDALKSATAQNKIQTFVHDYNSTIDQTKEMQIAEAGVNSHVKAKPEDYNPADVNVWNEATKKQYAGTDKSSLDFAPPLKFDIVDEANTKFVPNEIKNGKSVQYSTGIDPNTGLAKITGITSVDVPAWNESVGKRYDVNTKVQHQVEQDLNPANYKPGSEEEKQVLALRDNYTKDGKVDYKQFYIDSIKPPVPTTKVSEQQKPSVGSQGGLNTNQLSTLNYTPATNDTPERVDVSDKKGIFNEIPGVGIPDKVWTEKKDGKWVGQANVPSKEEAKAYEAELKDYVKKDEAYTKMQNSADMIYNAAIAQGATPAEAKAQADQIRSFAGTEPVKPEIKNPVPITIDYQLAKSMMANHTGNKATPEQIDAITQGKAPKKSGRWGNVMYGNGGNNSAPSPANSGAAKIGTQEEFDTKWKTLKKGEKLLAPDGNTYTKK
jgi:hypothetical protein